MKEDEESILSKFSNQDPGSGGYGEKEEIDLVPQPTRSKVGAAAKAKKKNKKKAAKKSRKKNRK